MDFSKSLLGPINDFCEAKGYKNNINNQHPLKTVEIIFWQATDSPNRNCALKNFYLGRRCGTQRSFRAEKLPLQDGFQKDPQRWVHALYISQDPWSDGQQVTPRHRR